MYAFYFLIWKTQYGHHSGQPIVMPWTNLVKLCWTIMCWKSQHAVNSGSGGEDFWRFVMIFSENPIWRLNCLFTVMVPIGEFEGQMESIPIKKFGADWPCRFWDISKDVGFKKSNMAAKSCDQSKSQGLGARVLIGPDDCTEFEICRLSGFWVLGPQKNGTRIRRGRKRWIKAASSVAVPKHLPYWQ